MKELEPGEIEGEGAEFTEVLAMERDKDGKLQVRICGHQLSDEEMVEYKRQSDAQWAVRVKREKEKIECIKAEVGDSKEVFDYDKFRQLNGDMDSETERLRELNSHIFGSDYYDGDRWYGREKERYLKVKTIQEFVDFLEWSYVFGD